MSDNDDDPDDLWSATVNHWAGADHGRDLDRAADVYIDEHHVNVTILGPGYQLLDVHLNIDERTVHVELNDAAIAIDKRS